jgi:hypothetical protein
MTMCVLLHHLFLAPSDCIALQIDSAPEKLDEKVANEINLPIIYS